MWKTSMSSHWMHGSLSFHSKPPSHIGHRISFKALLPLRLWHREVALLLRATFEKIRLKAFVESRLVGRVVAFFVPIVGDHIAFPFPAPVAIAFTDHDGLAAPNALVRLAGFAPFVRDCFSHLT